MELALKSLASPEIFSENWPEGAGVEDTGAAAAGVDLGAGAGTGLAVCVAGGRA